MAPPVVIRHAEQCEGFGDPGVRAHHVDPAELGDAQLDCPAAVVMNGYVTYEWDASLSKIPSSRLQLVSVVVERHDVRALIKEVLDDGETYALRRASDDDALSGEAGHARLQR
jgi:hypothetical protein